MTSGIHNTTWSGAMDRTEGDIIWANFSVLIGLYIPDIQASASTNGTTIVTDTPLPSSLRPSVERRVSGPVLSGGQRVDGTYTIGTDGVITASATGGFLSTGENGLIVQGISYLI